MPKIKTFLTILFAVCSMTVCNGQKIAKTILKDFNSLIGSWEGSLTYLDYTTGKPYTMSADIEIKRLEKQINLYFPTFILKNKVLTQLTQSLF